MTQPIITAVHRFTSADYDAKRMPFSPAMYAHLKYGNDQVAQRFGSQLADTFFNEHREKLLTNERILVIPSPYNFVKNAATIMTDHFVRHLNRLLIGATGLHVDYATIQRKISYTGDFGEADAETRRKLISNDVFYVHEDFFKDKTILFVDDIRITGAHEERLMMLMNERPALKDANIHFLYYGQLCGDTTRNDIEAYLNNAGMTLDDYLKMQKRPGNHVIVRPLKWLLRMPEKDFAYFLRRASPDLLYRVYDGCLGEGYYALDDYRVNFTALKKVIDKAEAGRIVKLSDARRA